MVNNNYSIREKSCGAVVYYERDGERLYLIEEMRGGHFAMPKGHVETGETEVQTAEREILEETGLQVKADTRFRAYNSYSPYPGCRKEVVYFTARANSMETSAQAEELRSILWLPYDEALRRLSYDNDREILRQAERYHRSGDPHGWNL